MNSIYISYSYNDILARDIVEALKSSLLENETIYYPDRLLFEYGQDIKQQLMETINKCNYFICIFDNSNPNIMFELGYALGKNKNIILIGEYSDIPYDLKDFNYIKRSDNINEVLIELNKRLYSDIIHDREVICYSEYRENIQRVVNEQDFLDKISYQDFEKIVYEYLKAQNLYIEYPLQSKDNGYDFFIPKRNCLVEVKKYSRNSKISLSVIRAILGTMFEMNVDRGIIISSSEFTNSAINFVQGLKQEITLLTLQDLLKIDGNFNSVFNKQKH
ncbi:restriction endonuclease [Lachnotalea glycerini]|uniref:TIR domain-containing protein n=1 Tax=Lachnotalea glycerini TaxID=1763509 RepID=A0A371JBG5_9FIRM|nr:restriction endonuclease [Lachnotalea glycerini]RDY30006.1 hypothetical protein CG710_016860 [Lachnotalea glycerini]